MPAVRIKTLLYSKIKKQNKIIIIKTTECVWAIFFYVSFNHEIINVSTHFLNFLTNNKTFNPQLRQTAKRKTDDNLKKFIYTILHLTPVEFWQSLTLNNLISSPALLSVAILRICSKKIIIIYKRIFGTENIKNCLWRFKSNSDRLALITAYSRTSVARTLMTRLPRQFRIRSWVPWKKHIATDLG